MKLTERTKDIIYISILFFLTLVFFEEMMFRGKILLLRDTFCDFLPWRIFARDSIRNGTIPLWNPYSRLGQPFLAFPQTAVFYPLNFLFYILPVLFAYRLFIILHIFLAGAFIYILMRHWRVLRIAAFVSAIIFMFNGVIVSRLEFLSFISTFIWIPLLIYLLDKSINKLSLYCCLLTGIVLSIQFLAGHTQTFYYSYILLCFYWFFRIISKSFSGTKLSFSLLPILPIITVTTIAISMIQFLPTFELFDFSVRHNQEVAVLSLSILAGIGSHYLALKFKSHTFVKILLPLIIIIDLFLVMKGINYYSDPEIYTKKSDTVEYLTKDGDLFRVGTMYNDLQRDLCDVRNESVFLLLAKQPF